MQNNSSILYLNGSMNQIVKEKDSEKNASIEERD